MSNVSEGVLFLALSACSVATVEASVRRMIVPDARDAVLVLSDASAANMSTDVRTRVTEEIIAHISTYAPNKKNRLIIENQTKCDMSELEDWWHTSEFGDPAVRTLATRTIIRELKEHLQARGLHWREHTLAQLRRFEGSPSNLDAWLQGFGALGRPDVGRKIAAKLRIIATADFLHGAFATRAADLVGLRRANCYIQDDDAGGSWLEMQALLTHACPQESVQPLWWDKASGRLHFPKAEFDEFVIYEDGLWSGSEAVRRIKAIAAAPPSSPVKFRFGVVTDFGLAVTRQAIRSLGLGGRVTVDATGSELLHFLKKDAPNVRLLGLEMSPEDYFRELHRHVEPLAFILGEDWASDEVRFCEQVGAQLVGRWLSRRSGNPASAEQVERFTLGGGRFASTVAFSRSVPKVCLPLLWLDGPVEVEGKRFDWRPLLVDARRISDESILYLQ